MRKRCLVTGGAGFIGSHLADVLLASGYEVLVIDDFSSGRIENLQSAMRSPGLTIARADIAASTGFQVAVEFKPDVVFLLAAQSSVRVSMNSPQLDARTNVLGLVNMLEAARRTCARVVFATSGGTIYGNVPRTLQPISESLPRAPVSIYGVAKSVAIDYLSIYGREFGLSWCALALGNVYGPRQRGDGESGVLAIYIHAMLNSLPLQVFGDGETSRDFVNVRDVVDAFIRAGDADVVGVLNIGTGVSTSVNELLSLIQVGHSSPVTVRYLDGLPGEVRSVALDWSAARLKLGWRPRIELVDGLKELMIGAGLCFGD